MNIKEILEEVDKRAPQIYKLRRELPSISKEQDEDKYIQRYEMERDCQLIFSCYYDQIGMHNLGILDERRRDISNKLSVLERIDKKTSIWVDENKSCPSLIICELCRKTRKLEDFKLVEAYKVDVIEVTP